MLRTGAILTLALIMACSGNNGGDAGSPEPSPATSDDRKLVSSVEVEVGANTVRMVLHVTNPTNRPVTLEFSSAQKYDFAILSADGNEIWRWSRDMGFAAALTSQTIPAGATAEFVETWRPGTRTGSFTAVAELTSLNHRLVERTGFQIPR
jgi:hypothetical protein